MDRLIKALQARLKEGLPGKLAQYRLIPESRHLFPDDEDNPIPAAVLILLYRNVEGILETILIKRPSYIGHHSAQVSFPGGKAEETDMNLYQTALRESMEEVGVVPNLIINIGALSPLYIPVSRFLVHPFIGLALQMPEFVIDKSEVDYLIPASIKDLIHAEVHYRNLTIQSKEFSTPYFNIKNEMVWGATAMIMSELIEVLKSTPAIDRFL